VENVVKLRGFDEARELVESFKHDAHPWSFWVVVSQATQDEYSEALQRLKPEEWRDYHDGNLNLFTVRVEAWVEGVQLGVYRSDPVWVQGLTVSGGKVRGEDHYAKYSSWFSTLQRMAIQNGVAMLSDVLGALSMGDARAEVERKAGIR